MTSLRNSSEEQKYGNIAKINQFKQDKLNEFNLNRDSRPSDSEQLDIFRPAINNMKHERHTFEYIGGNKNKVKESQEGVDDFDASEDLENGIGRNRTSMAEKYQFGGI
jgi:hypothetical protein